MQAPRWLRRNVLDPDGGDVAGEVVALRLLGIATLAVFAGSAFLVEPRAGLSGAGLGVLALLLGFLAAAVGAVPLSRSAPGLRTACIVAMGACGLGLLALQADGIWLAVPYLVSSAAIMRIDVRTATVLFVVDLLATVAVGTAVKDADTAVGTAIGVVPFFLFMRVMRRVREEHERTKGLVRELEVSRAAEAEAAADAERSRLAREMHDVLAHSLSALALQLESTRLLAARHDAHPDVVTAVDRAHKLAGSGLEEARRAISALRGDELPDLGTLVAAFRETSGIPCTFTETGAAPVLAADARLTLYRTAQEALTNVAKHAAAERAEVDVAHTGDATVLTVADHGRAAVVAGEPGGYGLTGMRERAELLGGELDAGPTPDGFRVRLRVPVR